MGLDRNRVRSLEGDRRPGPSPRSQSLPGARTGTEQALLPAVAAVGNVKHMGRVAPPQHHIVLLCVCKAVETNLPMLLDGGALAGFRPWFISVARMMAKAGQRQRA